MVMVKDHLYEAAISGDANAIQKLREEAERVSRDYKTILHTESMCGNTKNVQFILKEFANRSFLFKGDKNGETALHLAAYYGHTEVVKVLIDAARSLPPADEPINARYWPSSADDPISSVMSFIREPNSKKNTALHLAVRKHNVDIVELLVEADPTDTHIKNEQGESPVYLAAKRGYNDIVKLICKACKAPNLEGPICRTALHAVITRLHEAEKDDGDVVEVLLDAARRSLSANGRFEIFVRQTTDREGALHMAVRGNHLNVVKLLLHVDPGYPYEDVNSERKSPIYTAAERGYKDIL